MVDASGRRTALPAMLEPLGVTPRVLREETGFRYCTRFFRADGRGAPASRPWPLTHHNSLSLITVPADSDIWSVTLVASGRDQELRRLSDPVVWDRVLSLYPSAAHWADGVPLTDVRVMGGAGMVRRRWVADGDPLVTGLVAIGDAHMTSDPQFAMGMTAGLGQALLLRDTVRAHGVRDTVAVVTGLDARLEDRYWPMWSQGQTWDRHRLAEIDAEMRGEAYETDDPTWNSRVALEAAAPLDAELLRANGQTACMLATAEQALSTTGLPARVVELGAGRPRYRGAGPDRTQLLTTAGRAA